MNKTDKITKMSYEKRQTNKKSNDINLVCIYCSDNFIVNLLVIMQKIYQFIYTDCIFESAMKTVSLHKTKKRAYQAMRKFILDKYTTWYDERIMFGKYKNRLASQDKFKRHSAWGVRTSILNE